MGRFEKITKELDASNLERHNRNWDKADADLANQQAQVTAEQTARINADNAHAGASTAHQATQIAYDSSKNVKQKLDEQQAQVNNILVQAGSGNTAIDDMRLGADGIARQYPGLLIREIHAQQLEANMQTVTLKRGLNIL